MEVTVAGFAVFPFHALNNTTRDQALVTTKLDQHSTPVEICTLTQTPGVEIYSFCPTYRNTLPVCELNKYQELRPMSPALDR